MARQILVFNSLAAANTAAGRIHTFLQNNLAGYAAAQWCTPYKHPTLSKWAVTIRPRMAAALSGAEQAQVQDQTSDWGANHP